MLERSSPYKLIHTKFSRPPLDRRWNTRPRLIHQMNENAAKRLTLVSAPAGYGKTTLALQWAAQELQPVAWLSVDPNDSDPERFVRYLALAIDTVIPGFGAGITTLLTSLNLPPPEYLADTMISDLSKIDSRLSIVIDDYHGIEDASVQEIMVRMIQYLPANLHLIILTRVDPPWPLGNFRVRQWLGLLRAADLRFSRDESRIFLNLDRNTTIPNSIADTLHARTEGWVGGLLLARLAMFNAENAETFSRDFSGNDRLIVDFLMDEVITHQPPEILKFLTVTAILDRFCASLCDCLLPEGNDSRRLIAEVDKRNLFIVPLDNEGLWFRYHHLFQTLLIRHANANHTPECRRRIHYRAGKWFAGMGFIEDALKHLVASGEVDAAAELFGQHLHTITEWDLPRRTLLRLVNMFPHEAKIEQPALLVAQSCYLTYCWDLPGMPPLLEKAAALLRSPDCTIGQPMRRLLLANIDAQRGFYLYWLGDADGSLRHAQRALEVLPREQSWAYTIAVLYKAGSLAAIGQRDEALKFLSDVLSDDCRAGSRNVGTILAARMAIHLYAGDLAAVREVAHKVLKIHETVPVSLYWLSHAHYFLGSVAYEQNLLEDAADHFGHIEQDMYQVNSRIYHECLLGLALVSQARKDQANALNYADKAEAFAIHMNDPISRQMSESFNTRLAFLSGKEPAKPASLKDDNDANKLWMEFPRLTFAEYLITKSEPDCRSAFPVIEDAIKQAKQHHNTRQVIQFLAVKSVALKCAGKVDQAIETLKEALSAAEPLGFVRTFVDRGPIMAELLNELSSKEGTPYVRRLLDVFVKVISKKNPTASFANLSSASLLTNRELVILERLVKRLTYREIAEDLTISPETVKSHATSIYRKLKVSGRLQVIDTAQKMGFFSEKNN